MLAIIKAGYRHHDFFTTGLKLPPDYCQMVKDDFGMIQWKMLAGLLQGVGIQLIPEMVQDLAGEKVSFACGGFAGLYLSRFNTQLVSAQQVFSVLAGVIMLAVGLSVLGLLRLPRAVSGGVSNLFAPLYRHFLNARSTGGFFLAGIANGFLPCGLVYAFLAMAVTKESVSLGMLVMLCFGAGTVPVMVLIGCGSKLLSRTTRLRVYRVAACFVILAGIRTIVRGIPSGDAPCHTPVETTTTPTAPISVG